MPLPSLRRLAVRAYLRRLALDTKPILVGPWRSELGFEALYWLPFLRWAINDAGIKPERLVIVTRGGAAVLYGAQAIDLYTLRSVTDVRQENAYDYVKTKIQKQMACTPWDRDVLAEAARRVCGHGQAYHILHPSWMYWALEPWWEEYTGLRYVTSLCDFAPIPKPPLSAELNLPPRFVAMKWYARHTFPYPHPEVQAFVAAVTGNVSAQTPVVLLTADTKADEHQDIVVTGPNVSVLPSVSPEQNLALQAAVLAKATAFVGTYGGVSQLALRLGVPSVSFWHQFGGTAHAHLSLSEFLSRKMNVPFLTASLAESHVWKQVVSRPDVPRPTLPEPPVNALVAA